MSKRHPLHGIWWAMIQRCEYPKAKDFARYGGRGIRVCARWRHDFSAFVADMGPRPRGSQLDRRDNDGHYTPDNCRWATATEQSNNTGSNVRLTVNGETHTATEWARLRGIAPVTVLRRIHRGWTPERAVMTPVERPAKRGKADAAWLEEALEEKP